MKYSLLGKTGLRVSRLCLGCMSFGDPKSGDHEWSMPEDESRPIIRQAVEAGINFFDTANGYSGGTSEEIIGRALKDFAYRDEIVVATKLYFNWRNAPNAGGLSRKAVFAAVDDSLRRLGMDYIDLYQIHRWDEFTPIEETMEALHDLKKAGKVRYIGASTMHAWQFMKAQHVAVVNGWTPFVSMQNHLNLTYREEEREMLPLCADQGVGVIPWSPLARGRLTRPWGSVTKRAETDRVISFLYKRVEESDKAVVDALEEVSRARGTPMAEVALAWVLAKPEITAPIVGVTQAKHLEDAISALDVSLSQEEISALEAHYVPHDVSGPFPQKFSGRTSVKS